MNFARRLNNKLLKTGCLLALSLTFSFIIPQDEKGDGDEHEIKEAYARLQEFVKEFSSPVLYNSLKRGNNIKARINEISEEDISKVAEILKQSTSKNVKENLEQYSPEILDELKAINNNLAAYLNNIPKVVKALHELTRRLSDAKVVERLFALKLIEKAEISPKMAFTLHLVIADYYLVTPLRHCYQALHAEDFRFWNVIKRLQELLPNELEQFKKENFEEMFTFMEQNI